MAESRYASIAKRLEQGGADVFLLQDQETGKASFYRSRDESVERLDRFEGLFWNHKAMQGNGAFWGTWIENGERSWVGTSGSSSLEISRVEARLRLGGILMSQDGIDALWNPEWRYFEKTLERVARYMEKESVMENEKPLVLARSDMDRSLVEWIQSKTALESNPWPDSHQIPAGIPRSIDEAATDIQQEIARLANVLPVVVEEKGDPLRKIPSARETLHRASTVLGASVEAGTEHTLEQTSNPRVFSSWQEVTGAVESFARAGMREVDALQKQYPGVADYDLGYAAGSLNTAADVALAARVRGIRMSMNGPLAEYALEDAERIGLVRKPDPREQGILRGRLAGVAVVEHEDGSFVACPVPPGRYTETGKSITLHDCGDGVYTDRAPEKRVLPEPDQVRVLGTQPSPEVVTSWTGLVVGQEEDGSALYVRAADKITKVTLEDRGHRFPEIPAGRYGAVIGSPEGVRFEERTLGKQRSLQRR